MNSTYRIFIKFNGQLPAGKTDRVVHTEDVGAGEVEPRLRTLETLYPPANYNFQCKELNPLGL